MLHRLSYQRDGKPTAVIFFADDFVAALEFEALWKRCAKVGEVKMERLGQSRFVNRRGRTVLRRNENPL